ncbi:MAG: NAD(P)/FAD-dependent oxidoreductase [Candidatus Omnitrophica bacterium]|nr:NAD(P)/FAD-dependent oxidoreductase [Candidatus Omnitrophota bacterium]
MEGRSNPVIIIGGGASGILAAISVKRRGIPVVICERMNRLGRKILASGNGRCNLLNDTLDNSFYNPAARHLVDSVFSKFGKNDIKSFFENLGLKVYSEEGRIFPETNQSATVLKILDMELSRLSIPVEFDFKVSRITDSKNGFTVLSDSGKKVTGPAVILACGGRSYPALGSDGSAYNIAEHLGHTIIDPVPVAVPLIIKDELCHILQGQKIFARIKSLIDGKAVNESSGDLLFTKYGLSGSAILDISEEVSIAINRNRSGDAVLSIDMVPFMDEVELSNELLKRIQGGLLAEDLTTGILPNKFGAALKEILKTKEPKLITRNLKDRRFKVIGTRGWNEADFTAGGVDVKEVDAMSLGSVVKKGLYFAGEILDVNGKRGGYNLAWAWASGYIAGREAADCVK